MASGRANLLILFFAAILVAAPIALFGVPKGNDLPQHYQFAVTFRDSLSAGTIYPSWAPSVNAGFGDVGVRFYPPAAYYLLVLFFWTFNSWVYATAATVCALVLVGGCGVYLWCRESFGLRASLIGGLLYVLIPYHVNEIYNAFTFAEFAAASVLPFCFLFANRVLKRGATNDTIGLGVSLAALLLTHLPMAVIGSISLAVYAICIWIKCRDTGGMLRLLASLGLGSLLSAFYWVRMVSELSFVNHTADGFTSGDYDFRNNFVWSFFYSSAGQYSERSLGFIDLMLLITLAVAVAGVAISYWRSNQAEWWFITGPLAVLVTGLFFATPISAPVWARISLLQKTQFPWRWLAVISLVCCVLAAAGFEQLKDLTQVGTQRIAIVLCGLMIAAATFTVAQVIRPAIFLDRATFETTVEALATSKSCECWWPVWARSEALTTKTPVVSGERAVTIESWQPTDRTFRVSAGDESLARVATFYYPNWHARVDGTEVDISPDANGAILVPLPSAQSHVELYFEESRVAHAANYLSIAAWVSLIAFAIYRVTKLKARKLS